MNTALAKRLTRLEAANGFPEGWQHRDPNTMTDAQLIAVIEYPNPEILAIWPDWVSMSLDEKMAALVEAKSSGVHA
jgi:hypothetical protein